MGVVFRCNQPTRYMTATGAAKRAKRKANNTNSFSMATSCQVSSRRLTRRRTHMLSSKPVGEDQTQRPL